MTVYVNESMPHGKKIAAFAGLILVLILGGL